MILLDLFCGRWGWSRAFARRGWKCVGIDLTYPSDIPDGCRFIQADVLSFEHFRDGHALINQEYLTFDAIVGSSPCEGFAVHGMKNFHPNPKYPANGIRLFEHTRALCEASGLPYVMENVRAAQQFVGNAVHHCGSFYLWGNAVPPILHKGIVKGTRVTPGNTVQKSLNAGDRETVRQIRRAQQKLAGGRAKAAAISATIPSELANTVAEYMERLLEQRRSA